jgi:hypothetical protein
MPAAITTRTGVSIKKVPPLKFFNLFGNARFRYFFYYTLLLGGMQAFQQGSGGCPLSPLRQKHTISRASSSGLCGKTMKFAADPAMYAPNCNFRIALEIEKW